MINISAGVVCYNERKTLDKCLISLIKCDETLFFDMGSTDGSIEIARLFTTKVRQIPRVDIVEKVWNKVVSEAKNDWVILLDPDEVFPSDIFPALKEVIQSNPEVALIAIPWKYYFLGKPLTSSHWGRDHFKARVFNRQHIEISGLVFDGIKLKPGFKKYTFPYSSGYIIQHYWIDSIPQLFSKHWRYIKNDGEAKYTKGERFSIRRQLRQLVKTLRKDLFDYGGLKDGWRGIFLSFFHAWFIFMCHFSLLHYQLFTAGKSTDVKSA